MVDEVKGQCETAKVSGQVTFQAMHLPTFHGTSVTPSGLFSSDGKRPVGSLAAGIPERMQALISMSFNMLCLL